MKLFDRIKEWLGLRRLLKETMPDRRPVPKNLARCVKVGIVYLATDEKAHLDVRNYVKKLKEDLGLVKIQCIGYFDGKELPFHLHAKLNFDAFCQKDLNWYRIPSGNVVDNFIAEEHDVLLDLTLDDHLPLRYIVAKSRARFKVGRFSEGNKRFLDMMIDTAGARSLPQFIANIDRYMLMINARVEPSLN
ncbi:MAG: hypothetical protein JST41_09010 [Bacteroidetes bacterium]|nr:hypothetical protein [Bacteroidota bacterium]MBX7130674.1 hypothetical protein [Flavobacteriales bacterium]MCC6656424.1 hypothetical protein [Flavobacteriales bacterium]HMU15386.1 hypothetical protein [Flavobacteriales bacterium]HMW96347.1 hypothetical protein [Flavobacteriales bacterium]